MSEYNYMKTTDDIFYEVEHSDKFANELWIPFSQLILDLKSMIEAEDYAELKQCVSDLINELEELKDEYTNR
jgi:hypothetical protein